jgi:chromosome segregation ATPase
MADDMITKPTIETILERMTASDERFEQRFDQLEKRTDERWDEFEKRFEQFEKRTDERWDEFEKRFEQFEKRTDERFEQFEKRTDERFDRLEKEFDRLIMVTSSTRADMSELRLGFRELRAQVKELLPIPRE